jgi:transglutaminase-like putative cysteine protease
MVRLVPETAEYLYGDFTPRTVEYRPGSRPELERRVAEATAGAVAPEERVKGIAEYCLGIREKFEAVDPDGAGLEDMVFGGTEEEIIERGTDWCADLGRVACALCQVAGIPARIVNLVELGAAYGGHVIIEAWRDGAWGAVDPLHEIVYTHPDGRPVAVRELVGREDFPYQAAAIANYFISDRESYS